MKKMKSKVVLVIAMVSLITAVLLNPVFAQQVSEDMGITISPVKYEFSGAPGEVIKAEVKFFNVTRTRKDLYLRTLNFEPIGETGFPAFMEKDDLPFVASLKQWIVLENDQVQVDPVEPDRSIPAIVKFRIEIPENAAAGGHYAGIIQSQKEPGEETEIIGSGMVISPESACLIILNVDGDVVRRGSSEQFYVTDPFSNNKKPMKLFEYPPVLFMARIRNDGNTHFKPQGNIFLYRGDKQIATIRINEDEGNILKDSIRLFEEDIWGSPEDTFISRVEVLDDEGKVVRDDDGNIATKINLNWNRLTNIAFGKYEAKLAVVFDGENGKEVIKDSVTFWIIPWKLLLVLLAIIMILVAIWLDKSRKKKKRRKSTKSDRTKTNKVKAGKEKSDKAK